MLFAFFSMIAILHQAIPHSLTCNHDKDGRVAAAWYAGWHATNGFPLSKVSWGKYNTLIYAFAITTPSVDNLFLEGSNLLHLPEFVSAAHANGVAAHIAIGGWAGSLWFSSNLDTAANRSTFVRTVVDFAESYRLDGINFDWEYPNHQGIGCNTKSPNDTQNFLLFLRELRNNPVGAKLTLSAATSITPFRDAIGNPSTDVSGFAEVLDYITIMSYDIWGPWSSVVGPNSPLNDRCASSAHQAGSAVSAVRAWNAAGMPVHQIVLGVPTYGHSFSVSRSHALPYGDGGLVTFPPFNASHQPPGDSWSNTGGVNICGAQEGPGGTFNMWGLVNAGFLTTEGNPAPGINGFYDTCSETPYIYNKSSEVMVSFDNDESFEAKGHYIKQAGLRGFAMWKAGGDYNDILLDSIRSAAGFDNRRCQGHPYDHSAQIPMK